MSDFDPARTTEEAAYGVVLDPFHLVKPDHPWYANIEGRLSREHFGVAARLERVFRSSVKRRDEYVHLGLVGHGGTGKTTLVRQAMADLREIGILPVYVNALKTLDPTDFTFSDVVLVLADAIVTKLANVDPNIALDPVLIKAVRDWFSDVIVSETHRKELIGELTTEAEAGLSVPLLARLLARIKGTLRSSNDYRTEIRKRADRDPDELVRRVNGLIDGVHQALAARKQRICVVFDNLEKIYSRPVVERAVLLRADDLRRLRCHVIYFLAPADEYAPEKIQASQAFRIAWGFDRSLM